MTIIMVNLQRRYDSFINSPEKGFYLGISDYINYLLTNPEFEELIVLFKNQENQADEKVDRFGRQSYLEIEKVYSEAIKKIKDQRISLQQIDKIIEEFPMVLDGRLQSTASKVEMLYSLISKIVELLFLNGHRELIKDFIETDNDTNQITSYKISPSLRPYLIELANFREIRESSIWGSWDKLVLVYLVVHRYREEVERMAESKYFWQRMNFHAMHEEMKKILGNSRDDGERIQFNKEDYKTDITRVHNFVIDKLGEFKQTTIEQSDPKKIPQREPEDLTIDTDQWLTSKSEQTINRMRRVVNALNYEWELRDKDNFKIPHEKFRRNKITNTDDLEAILTTLHTKGFIEVARKIAETPPSTNPEVPSGSLWLTINDKSSIVHLSDTQVKIFPKKFTYLVKRLAREIYQKQEPDASVKDLVKSKSELRWGDLNINLEKGVVKYKDYPSVEISPNDVFIKLLVFLMENKRIVYYSEIAEKLKMNCFHAGVSNKDVARDVQFVRRDLGNFLKKKVEMSTEEIKKMIISKRNLGYKIQN